MLLDELGAGTDPQEGSALARAIVSRLLQLGPLVVATTHYPELKAYAFATPGVENASVEFDVETLAPTYRLMIGVPGRSNALAIAGRLGMPREILETASGMLDPDELRVDSLLQDIRRRRDEADAILERARADEEQARALRDTAARELQQAEYERREARTVALSEAEADAGGSSRDAASDCGAIERRYRSRASTWMSDDAKSTRPRTRSAHSAGKNCKSPPPTPGRKPISAGDRVRVVPLDQEGEVIAVDRWHGRRDAWRAQDQTAYWLAGAPRPSARRADAATDRDAGRERAGKPRARSAWISRRGDRSDAR